MDITNTQSEERPLPSGTEYAALMENDELNWHVQRIVGGTSKLCLEDQLEVMIERHQRYAK